MSVKLLNEHHLEFLSLKGGYTSWSESTLVKMPHCWKSHATAQFLSWFSLAGGQNKAWNVLWIAWTITMKYRALFGLSKQGSSMNMAYAENFLMMHARIQKVLWDFYSNVENFFLVDEGWKGTKYHYKRTIIDLPAKRHLNWPTLNFVILIFQGTETSIAKKPYSLVIFKGWGIRTTYPPSRSVQVTFWTFFTNENHWRNSHYAVYARA